MLVFATQNNHKLKEVNKILREALHTQDLTVISALDAGITEEIPETGNTLDSNACQKAHFVFDHTGENCFADDTGLEVDALNGEPGVYSARYAGESKSSEDNIDKLLLNLEGIENRKARFRTVICLIWDREEYLFEGVVEGKILMERHGVEGFGYDPVFQPDGYTETFAQMSLDLKNQISHRGRATQKLIDFLKHKIK